MEQDSYTTLAREAGQVLREKSSKFLAFAYPVEGQEQIRERIEELRKRYYDATHHCYAWRLGPKGETSRANDDGEPAGTAGRPILGQMLSAGVTDTLVVVVRYFGGTKLGVPGLIAAYKESAARVIAAAGTCVRTVERRLRIGFPYRTVGEVMRIVKETGAQVRGQHLDNSCVMELSIRSGSAPALAQRLRKVEGLTLDES